MNIADDETSLVVLWTYGLIRLWKAPHTPRATIDSQHLRRNTAFTLYRHITDSLCGEQLKLVGPPLASCHATDQIDGNLESVDLPKELFHDPHYE